jgi:hypothetical protein
MTLLFAQEFKKPLKCAYCAQAPLTDYSLCSPHLVQARERFRSWAKKRRRAGLCIRCACKSFRGYLRCRKHTVENRRVCKVWSAAHPDYCKRQWEKSKAVRDAGFCPSCREHPKLEGPFRRCEPCRKRSRGYRSAAQPNV